MKLNKFTRVLCLAIVSVLIMASTAMAVNVNSFVDFPDDWSTPAMEYAVENGLIKGYEDNTIRADRNITRAEMGAIVNRAFGSFVEATKFPYLDVEDVAWFYKDMKKAVNMGTMQGSDNLLRPDDAITREEAFIVIARAYSQKNTEFSVLEQYEDYENISGWAKEHLSFLTENDYVNGFDDGNLYPKSNLTRAELSQVLYNMISEYVGSQKVLDEKSEYDGNIIINGKISNITGKTFKGDLVIGDGVGVEKIVIQDTKINGCLIVRGTTQIKIVNTTVGNRIIVNNPNNNVHFDNYKTEKVFKNVEVQTSATWKKYAAGGGSRYFTVHFKDDNGYIHSMTVAAGSKVSRPADPTRTGYTFGGWYTNEDCTTPYDFSTPVNGNLSIYAKWIPNKYTVTFNYNGGTPGIVEKEVTYDSTYGEFPETGREGYTFDGWYIGDDKIVADTQVKITSDTEVKAKWTAKTYTLSFDSKGGSAVADITVTYDSPIGMLTIPEKTGYTFKGWTIDGDLINLTTVYKFATNKVAEAKWEANKYTLTFEGLTNEIEVTYDGEYPTLPTPSIPHGQNFVGWFDGSTQIKAGNPVKITKDTHLVPKYTDKPVYVVTFDANGGSGASTQNVIEGETAQIPTDPTREGHTFKGWYNEASCITKFDFSTPITGAKTVYAKWEIKTYTVTFKDWNGTILDTQTVNHSGNAVFAGVTPSRPADNTYTYTFDGWDKSLVNITDDTTVTAKYISTYIDYTVKFVAEGTIVKTFTKHYNEVIYVADFPEVPSKIGHNGVWSVTTDITVNSSIEVKAIYEPATYKLTFEGLTDEIDVTYGKEYPTLPTPSIPHGQNFVGWFDGSTQIKAGNTVEITSDTELKPVFTDKAVYTVTFNANGGKPNSTQSVIDGDKAVKPTDPTREGHTFKGWFKDAAGTQEFDFGTEITGDIELYAGWSADTYTITFKNWDGSILETKEIPYGTTATYTGATPEKPADAQYTYTFSGWSPALGTVTGEAEFVAQFEKTVRQYTYKFFDEDGITVLKEATVDYGTIIIAPTNPTKAADAQYTYTFKEWEGYTAGMTVAGDVTFKAVYEKTVRQYTYKFLDEDGATVLKEATVDYGTTIAPPTDPTKSEDAQYTYTFKEWEGYTAGMTVAEDVTFKAVYEKTIKSYEITFKNYDGSVLETKTINYGETITYTGATPEKSADVEFTYTFSGWSPALGTVTGEAEFVAQFEKTVRQYTYKFFDEDGATVLKEATVDYGTTIVAPTNPTKSEDAQYTYTFKEWEGYTAGMTVAEDVTFKAVYEKTIKSYEITFKNYDGSVLETKTINYGETITYTGATPEKPADVEFTYTFSGWSPTLGTVTGEAEFVAQFEKTVRQYTYKFFDEDGATVIKEATVDYGTTIVAPADPTKAADAQYTYTFKEWEGYTAGMTVAGDVTFKAVYEKTVKPYTITFKNWNGQVLETKPINYGDVITYTGATPEKEGYTFDYWTIDSVAISMGAIYNYGEDKTVVAEGWTANQYTVVYDGNGALGSTNESYHTYDVDENLTSNGFVKAGNTFLGWSIDKNATAATYTDEESVRNLTAENNGVVVLYAIWKPNTYYVSYNANSGTGTMTDSEHKYGINSNLAKNEFEKTGYTFTGWAKLSTATTPEFADEGEVSTIAGPVDGARITLYAVWEANTYKVIYNGNGNTSGSTLESTHKYDEIVTLRNNGFVKTGYKFMGWDTDSSGTKVVYEDGKTGLSNLTTEQNGEVNLYAVWEPITYTIKFVDDFDETFLKDGDNLCEAYTQTFIYDEEQELKTSLHQHKGYHVIGWTDIVGGAEAKYLNPEYVNTENANDVAKTKVKNLTTEDGAEIIFYTVWQNNNYFVAYDGDNATSGVMENSEHLFDVESKLSKNTYKKVGYDKFIGWNLVPEQSTFSTRSRLLMAEPTVSATYQDEHLILNLTEILGDTVDLIAVWQPNKYYVQYNKNDDNAVGNMNNSEHYYDQEKELTGNSFKLTGYTFAGWTTEKGGEVRYADRQNVSNLTAVNEGIVELYAAWTENKYTIKFDGKGGASEEGMSDIEDIKYAEVRNLPENTFKKTGYTFKGWSISSEATKVDYADKASVSMLTEENNGVVTLYAVWEPITYFVSYDGNGATEGTMSNSTHTYGIEAPLTANAYKKAGFAFKGWDTASAGETVVYDDAENVKNLADEQDKIVTLYAVWGEDEYRVIYDGNGATEGEMQPSTHLTDTPKALTQNAFKKKGHNFLGWSEDKDATVATYTDEQVVKNLTSERDITLYAIWEASTYKVTFDVNGGNALELTDGLEALGYYEDAETGKITVDVTYGGNYPQLPIATYPEGEMSFGGWSLEDEIVASGDTVEIIKDTELVAVWTNKHIVIFHGYYNDGADSYTTYVEDGEAAVKPEAPSHSSFTFSGWYTDEECTDGNEYDFATIINKVNDEYQTIHLYPKWLITVRFYYGPEAIESEKKAEITVQYNTIIAEEDIPESRIAYGYWKDASVSEAYVGEEYEHNIEFMWHEAIEDDFELFDLTQPITKSLDLFNVAKIVDIDVSSSFDAIDGANINAVYTDNEPLYENILDVIFANGNLVNSVYEKIEQKEKVFDKLESLGIIDENKNILNQARFLKFALIGEERLETFVYENVENELAIDAKESISSYLNHLIEKNDGSAESFIRELIETLLKGDGKEAMKGVLKDMLTEMVDLEKDEFVKHINDYIDNSLAKGDTTSVENLIAPQIERLLTEAIAKDFVREMTKQQLTNFVNIYVGTLSEAEIKAEVKAYIEELDEAEIEAEVVEYVNSLSDAEIENEITTYINSMTDTQLKEEITLFVDGMDDNELSDAIVDYINKLTAEELKAEIKGYIKGLSLTEQKEKVREYFDELETDEIKEEIKNYISDLDETEIKAEIKNYINDLDAAGKKNEVEKYIDDLTDAEKAQEVTSYVQDMSDAQFKTEIKDYILNLEDVKFEDELKKYLENNDEEYEKLIRERLGLADDAVITEQIKNEHLEDVIDYVVTEPGKKDEVTEKAAQYIIESKRAEYEAEIVTQVLSDFAAYKADIVDKAIKGDLDSYIDKAVAKIVAGGNLNDYIDDVVEDIATDSNTTAAYINKTVEYIVADATRLDTYIGKAVSIIVTDETKKNNYISDTAYAIATGSDRTVYVEKAVNTIINDNTLKAEYTQKAIDDIVNGADKSSYVTKAVKKILTGADREQYIDKTIDKIFADGEAQTYIDKAVAKIVDKTPADYSEIDEYIEKMFATPEKKDKVVNYINEQFISNSDFREAILPDAIDMIFKDEAAKAEVVETIVDYVMNDEAAFEEMIDIAIEDLVDDADFREKTIDKIAHYLEDHPEIMDKVLEYAKESELGVFVDEFVEELMNKNQFTVHPDNIFVAEAIERALGHYDYDSFMNEYIPERFAGLIPDSILKPIYENALGGFKAQLETAIEAAKNGEIAYVDSGVTVKFNPIADIIVPVFDKYLEFKEKAEDKLDSNNGTVGDIYDNTYGENKYLKELVNLIAIESLLDGDKSLATETLSGYSLKKFIDYYEIIRNATVLLTDTGRWCIEKLPKDKAEAAQEKLAQKITEYFNSILALVNTYAETEELPSYKDVLEIFEGDIPDRFFAKYESALGKVEAKVDIDDKLDTVYNKLAEKGIVSKFNTVLDKFIASKFNREIKEEQIPLVYTFVRRALGYDDFYTVDTVFNVMNEYLTRFKVNEDKFEIGNNKLKITIERSYK